MTLFKCISFLLTVFVFFTGCSSGSKNTSYSREQFASNIMSHFNMATMSHDAQNAFSVYRNKTLWHYNFDLNKGESLVDLPDDIIDLDIDASGHFVILFTQATQGEIFEYNAYSYDFKNKALKNIWKQKGKYLKYCGLSADDKKTFSFVLSNQFNRRRSLYSASISQSGDLVKTPEQITDPDFDYTCGSFTQNHKFYAFTADTYDFKKDLFFQDLTLKKLSKIYSIKNEDLDVVESSYLTDSVFVLGYLKSDFQQVYQIYKDGRVEQKTFENWNIQQFVPTKDNKSFFIVTNEDGYSKLKVLDENFKLIHLANLNLTHLNIMSLSEDGKKILLRGASETKPYELYLYNLKANTLLSLTAFNSSQINSELLSKAETVKIKSEDGSHFSAIVYKPTPENNNGLAIIDVHGGPHSQYLPKYNEDAQFLANRGFTVIQPNYRGSSGYGLKFNNSINQDWGGGHMLDIDAAKNYLIRQLKINEKKIAIIGFSYGGFTSGLAITQKPNAYCAAISGAAIYNILTFIEETNQERAVYTEEIGSPLKDHEKLKARSAIYNADKIKTPLLIIYGEQDKTVLKTQSEEFMQKLDSLNIKYEKIYYDNEGHGVNRFSNYIFYLKEIASFIENNCKN